MSSCLTWCRYDRRSVTRFANGLRHVANVGLALYFLALNKWEHSVGAFWIWPTQTTPNRATECIEVKALTKRFLEQQTNTFLSGLKIKLSFSFTISFVFVLKIK